MLKVTKQVGEGQGLISKLSFLHTAPPIPGETTSGALRFLLAGSLKCDSYTTAAAAAWMGRMGVGGQPLCIRNGSVPYRGSLHTPRGIPLALGSIFRCTPRKLRLPHASFTSLWLFPKDVIILGMFARHSELLWKWLLGLGRTATSAAGEADGFPRPGFQRESRGARALQLSLAESCSSRQHRSLPPPPTPQGFSRFPVQRCQGLLHPHHNKAKGRGAQSHENTGTPTHTCTHTHICTQVLSPKPPLHL